MISFYFPSKRFFRELEGLPDARVVSITKKEYEFAVHCGTFFVNIHKAFKANI